MKFYLKKIIIRYIVFLEAVLFLNICFSSCEKVSTRDYFAFADKEFLCEVKGEIDDLAFGATIHSIPKNSNCEFVFEVTYIFPEALRGIKIKKLQNDNLIVEGGFGEFTSDADLNGMVDFVHMILSEGEQKSLLYENGKAKISIGSKNCEAEFIFDSQSGQPISAEGVLKDRKINLIFEWFEYK